LFASCSHQLWPSLLASAALKSHSRQVLNAKAVPLKIGSKAEEIQKSRLATKLSCGIGRDRTSTVALGGVSTELFGQHVAGIGARLHNEWTFVGWSRTIIKPKLRSFFLHKKGPGVYASLKCACHSSNSLLVVQHLRLYSMFSIGWANSQIASSVFTLGTAAVLPFYTLMVVAPKAELTKKSMGSTIPYVVLGLLYTYLLYLSWTPDTIRLMFASQYWLPELPGIAKMFSNELTLASAWIHLLTIDLFAARHIFHDGLENEVETRHSVSLCLLFCPVGIISHVITKALSESARKTKPRIH
ncbi:hypothetical protein RJ639_007658, partial [Escallonia herrerae]